MKKIVIFWCLLVAAHPASAQKKSIYDFKVADIDGNEYILTSLKGKKILIVNTASECGYTPQYKDLEKLYELYKDSNFTVIGFPANNFGGQEPGSNTEIKLFCSKNYGVTFPMMGKISVKGDDTHPLYQWLTQKEQNGVSDAEVRWNFHKFLIDEKGQWAKSVSTKVNPLDTLITNWISRH